MSLLPFLRSAVKGTTTFRSNGIQVVEREDGFMLHNLKRGEICHLKLLKASQGTHLT